MVRAWQLHHISTAILQGIKRLNPHCTTDRHLMQLHVLLNFGKRHWIHLVFKAKPFHWMILVLPINKKESC